MCQQRLLKRKVIVGNGDVEGAGIAGNVQRLLLGIEIRVPEGVRLVQIDIVEISGSSLSLDEGHEIIAIEGRIRRLE